MKKLLFLAIVLVAFSCGETKQEKQLKVLKSIAERTEKPQYDPWDIGTNDVAPTHAKLWFQVVDEWSIETMSFKKVCVNININSGYADLRAISLVVDYDEVNSTLLPFDKTSVHPALTAALSGSLGAMMSNINNGKFYFAYYCLAPMELNVTGNDYCLLELTFQTSATPAPLIFDKTPGNVEFSIDGYNNLILELEDTVL